MKKLKRVSIVAIMFLVLLSITAYANDVTWENASGHHNQSVLLPASENTASDTVQRYARGEFLSSGTVELTNQGNGNIYIRAVTYAHCNVDMIRHTIFLDQWDDDEEDWVQINYWDFREYKENVENEELTHFSTGFTVSGYPSNKYYRLRGLHAVELNDEIEACATETNGILITNTSN